MSRWHARLAEIRGDAPPPSLHVQNVQFVQKSSSVLPFEPFEQIERACESTPDAWTDEQDERAAIVEHDGRAPPDWAEGFTRLDQTKAPANISPRRWLRFIDDCGHFLDDGWAARAAALGWGPLHLFGCDRKRPFARLDHRGLLWEINGGRLIVLYRDGAIIETPRGDRIRYRRRPLKAGHVVLAWKLSYKL
jgi:hypothetical protein